MTPEAKPNKHGQIKSAAKVLEFAERFLTEPDAIAATAQVRSAVLCTKPVAVDAT